MYKPKITSIHKEKPTPASETPTSYCEFATSDTPKVRDEEIQALWNAIQELTERIEALEGE